MVHKSASPGFTLLELMIAVTLSVAMIGIGGVKYLDFNKIQSIKGAGQTFKNNLRAIQGKALASVKPAGCPDTSTLTGYLLTGINPTKYSSQATCTPSPGTVDLVTYTLPTGIYFRAVPDNFTFRLLGQGTSLVSGQVMTLQNAPLNINSTKFYSVCVSPGGDIKDCGYAASSPPACTC